MYDDIVKAGHFPSAVSMYSAIKFVKRIRFSYRPQSENFSSILFYIYMYPTL